MACIACSIAEGSHPIPDAIANEALARLDARQKALYDRYIEALYAKRVRMMGELDRYTADGCRLDDLVDGFPYGGLGVADYTTLPELYGLVPLDLDRVVRTARSFSPYLCRSLITYIVRRDCFEEGLLGEAVTSGALAALLRTLRDTAMPHVL